jgi:hypothetical protein
MSTVTSWRRIILETGGGDPTPGHIGSLQMMLVKFNRTTNSVYWQQMNWNLVSKLISFTVKTENNKNKRNLLLLGSSHGREIGPMVQENLDTKYYMCSIFKPSDPDAKVVEDIGKFCKGLTKQDHHIIIVGGPGNSLDRNYHYSIENDLNLIAEDIKQQCGICQPL